MRVSFAAFAAWVAMCVLALPVHAADPISAASSQRLTLDAAFARVADRHPDLRLFGPRRDGLIADRDRAALRPVLVAGATVENAFGSGDASGTDIAEFTLTLASVLERGGKLDARRTLAQSRIDALAVQRESLRLDLLGEVARRYLDVVAAARQREIAEFDIAQRTRTVAAARRRLDAGASPESVVLTAQAQLAKAELDRARAQQRSVTARQSLAALWGERAPSFDVVAGDPLVLPAIDDLTALADLLQRTPEITRFVGEARIREARLQLARADATADLDWQVGARRLQATDDVALIGSVSMALGTRGRAQPEIRAAEAELAALGIERESKELSLYSTLTDAHGRYTVSALEVARLRDDVLPKLTRAENAAERAYRGGAISYLEWAQLQSERTLTRKQQLEVALDAQRALIEIQRLTGQAFVAGAVTTPTPDRTP